MLYISCTLVVVPFHHYFLVMAANVFGTSLNSCSDDPVTGYFRDGFCNTGDGDSGTHVVCAEVTEEFLQFTATRRNDLSTPRPAWLFPGLKAGDRWCLCVLRWKEARDAGYAPSVVLNATHIGALEYVNLDELQAYAVPGSEAGR